MTRLDLLVDLIQLWAQAQVLSQAFSLARGIPEITRAVAGMVLVSASAVLLAASGVGLRNDPQAKIAKGGEFLVQPIPSVFEVLQVFGHRASLSGCLLSIKIMGQKKGKVNFYPFLCRTPYSTFRGAAKLYWIYLSSSNSLGLFQAVTAVLANQNRQFEYKSQTVVWA